MPGSRTAPLLRTAFGVLFAVSGFLLGREAYVNVFSQRLAGDAWQVLFLVLSPVIGAVIGVLLAPLAQSLFERELQHVEVAIERLDPTELAGGAVGLIAGLVIAFLLKSILFEFVTMAGRTGTEVAIVLYVLVSLFAALLGARVGAKTRIVPLPGMPSGGGTPKLLDTSAIVDARIVELVEKDFLEPPIIVPRFVLVELHTLADSSDPLKRARGRRGLEALARLQQRQAFEIEEYDYRDLSPGNVDAKLVRLARELRAKIVTCDYGLDRLARVEGARVVNLNDLAVAMKPEVLPGEDLRVQIVREGREPQQGVAYLDDGTMIVVEQARRYIGESLDVQVTSVLQTAGGRMIFARPKQEAS
jgi:uncharacterized protein YacL